MSLGRKVRANPQAALFEVGAAWQDEWWGMPDFSMGDARPLYRITVNIYTVDDLREFGARIGIPVTTKTDSVTFPLESIDKPSDWVYTDEA